MQRMPYMSDPTIIPRVQEYLETNVDKTYVDINVMADELQKKYREYAKRKRSAFRASVSKAYKIVLQNYPLEDLGSSDDDAECIDDYSTSQNTSAGEFNNSMNNQLTKMYTSTRTTDESELIDISSEDSDKSSTVSNGKGISSTQKRFIYTDRSANRKRVAEKEIKIDNREEVNKKRKVEDVIVPPVKENKKRRYSLMIKDSTCSFKDIAGVDKTLQDVCKLIMHLKHPEIYKNIGIPPPRGILLHGPPGCGKTLLANAIAGELKLPLLNLAAPELIAGVSGESEERIRDLFDQVKRTTCVLFIDEIDSITPNRQNAQKEMERRIVAQLLSCMDELNECEHTVLIIGATNRPDAIDPALRRAGRFDKEICLGIPDTQSRAQILKHLTSKLKLSENFNFELLASYTPGYVGADLMALTREAAMVAVNRLFDEIKESRNVVQALEGSTTECPPNPEQLENTPEAQEVLPDPESTVSNDIPSPSKEPEDNSVVVVIDDDFAVKTSTPKSSPAKNETIAEIQEVLPLEAVKPTTPLDDMLTWLHDASPLSENQLKDLCLSMSDFEKALKLVQPSAKREGFATVPDVTWDDIGSLRDVRDELQMAIVAPVRYSKQFDSLGIKSPTGVLLCGPPGCGKTLLAKAIANEAGINFISVKGPELLNMYVGESERAVRVCFERARNSAPCVIFFDELDALCPKRSDSREGGASTRVVNQMLTEMDGIEARKGVFLLAASNRPDIIDSAVLRPGRLDKILYVGLPSASDRVDILRAITKNGTIPTMAPDVNLEEIARSEQCRGYTGADLAALIREASIGALKDLMVHNITDSDVPAVVTMEHFNQAVRKIRPSVSDKDQKHYEKLRKMYVSVPDNAEVEEMEYS